MEVGAAIVGLIVAGAQISAALHRFISGCTNAPAAAHSIYQEVNEFRIVLQKLQYIVSSTELEPLDNAKASLIDTGPISITLVQCVCTFSELEKELKRMKLDELNLEGKKLGVWHRMKWNFMEQTMSTMISRIQNHKNSLGLLLSVLITYGSIWSSLLLFGEGIECFLTRLTHMAFPSEAIGDVKGLVQDFHAIVAQGVVPLPKRSIKPDSDFRPSTYHDITESSLDNDASSIRTTTGSSIRSQSILPSLQSTLFSSRPYRNRSSSESIISVATSKRRGGNWTLDAGDSKYSVFSLPVSVNTTSGISLAEAPPISQIHLAIPAKILHDSNWSTNFYSDPSRLYGFLTVDERTTWSAPSPPNLGGSLFLKAVYKGLTTLVFLFLLDSSIPKDARTQDGYNALDLAAEYGHVEIAQMLLEKGADANSSYDGNRALHRAVVGGSIALIQMLLDKGADLEARELVKSYTPLHLAARYAVHEVVSLLLDRGANINAKAADEDTPLHLAAKHARLEVARLLLDKGANIEAKAAYGYTPLHLAAKQGFHQNARLLLDRGANINAKAADEDTPLHLAVKYGFWVAPLLLDKGASINAKAADKYTPWHIAAEHARLEVARLLLDKGANINAKAADEYTPLHLAAKHGYVKFAWLLLDKGANIDARTSEGETPLHLASKSSPETSEGETPPHLASKYSPGMVERLVKAGANLNVKNHKGETVRDQAIKHKNTWIITLLSTETDLM
jgi:ankyrin repeat protein